MVKPKIPVINWNHPITRGLVFDVPFFEMGKTAPMEIISKTKGTLVGTFGWQEGIFGPEKTWNGGNTGDGLKYALISSQTNPSEMTIEQILYVAASGVLTHFAASWGQGNATTQRVSWEVLGATPTGLKWFLNTNSTVGAWTTPVPPNSAYLHLVYTQDVGNLAAPVIYYNAVAQTNTVNSTPAGTPNSDQGQFVIGNTADFEAPDNCSWQGPIVYTRMWNRILNQQEVKQLYSNPWQIYKQPGFYQSLNSIAAGITNHFLSLLGVGT